MTVAHFPLSDIIQFMKKNKYFPLFTLAVVLFSMYIHPLWADSLPSQNETLEIRSDTMIAQSKSNSIIFEGSVTAQKGAIILKAGKMTAHYDENRTVQKVVAENEVVLLQNERTITADHAVYDALKDTVSFTGNPVFREGKNTVSGTKIIYYIKDERSFVENSRVILHE